MIDRFLHRHEVDVGRFLAALAFFGALFRLYDVIGSLLVGRVSVDFGVPIGAMLGVGLWRHRPWARTLVMIGTGAAGALVVWLVVLAVSGLSHHISFTLGSVTVQQPSPVQGVVIGCLALLVCGLVVMVLNSETAKEEFRRK